MNEAKSIPWRRWLHRLFLLGAGLILTALVWVWFFFDAQRQDKWMRTLALFALSYAAFLLWVLFASGWRARGRWSVFIGTIIAVGFCASALRIRGVDGDMLPILEWRWKSAAKMKVERASALAETAGLTNRYPQFLGPDRNGVLPGPILARDWTKHPPIELWRHTVGAAWSGFAIEGPRAVTQEQRGADEAVVCYEVLTGKELWAHADKSRYATTIAGEGPRATPTIHSDRVYSMGGAGILTCLDPATGKKIWSKDTLAEHGARLPDWGVACSPLVTERAVVVAVGGIGRSIVAYERDSGAVLWKAGNDDAHWSSPIRVSLAGVSQILIFSENVTAHDESTGAVLWFYPWRNPYPHVSVPIVVAGDRVLVSQGYGAGSELLQVTREGNRWRAARVWKSIRLKSKFANMVMLNGFVYGLDDGALVCLEVSTGELQWKGERYGHGQMILVEKLLLIMAENGEVVLVEPVPAESRVLARFRALKGKTWNPPALAGDLLLVRNDREAVCFRLKN